MTKSQRIFIKKSVYTSAGTGIQGRGFRGSCTSQDNVNLSPGRNQISIIGRKGKKQFTDACEWTLHEKESEK